MNSFYDTVHYVNPNLVIRVEALRNSELKRLTHNALSLLRCCSVAVAKVTVMNAMPLITTAC